MLIHINVVGVRAEDAWLFGKNLLTTRTWWAGAGQRMLTRINRMEVAGVIDIDHLHQSADLLIWIRLTRQQRARIQLDHSCRSAMWWTGCNASPSQDPRRARSCMPQSRRNEISGTTWASARRPARQCTWAGWLRRQWPATTAPH